jgi:hypothetical protein
VATTSTGSAGDFADRLPVVAPEAVQRVAPLDHHAGRRHVGDLDGVVLARGDGLRQVEADLLGIDVEGCDEGQVGDVVVAELDVHQAGHASRRVGVPVVLDALDQRRRAVADADDGDADRVRAHVCFS